ncbi:type IV conjugative transfer system coupling protein TraD [Methylophaga sp.]|uniref:type IV conjugative transfer system coupling protein TraD n=1 Tax=Methylophaga sp. TaxID=2024840 RepID=UPI002725243A|nr:type IV conjugative transfer system coupling protein TraD [Methylophaga sp.]MDO8828243.1 type IV conjugative transfer system coupling protein TraD [Methylophaga sp.]
MKSHYPVEALLRPPVELWSAACAFSCALIAGLAPWAMMMTPSVAYATAVLLTLFGLSRTRDAWRVLRYQRNMRKLPRYEITANAIPVSHQRLFLGKGFLWQQQHSQRLRDTLNPRVRHYIEPSVLYQLARRLEIRWEHTPILKGLASCLQSPVWWNPVAPLPPVGGKAAIHAVEWREQTVTMDLRERVGHILVLGTTRVGKTRLAELLITQDIARGDTVIVFDPKGDAALMKRVVAEAKRAGRSKALYIFHLGYPEISCRYNAIGNFSRITEVATRLTNPLPSEGNSAAFREFAWRFTNMIAVALVKMGKRPDYQLITRYITHIEPLLTDYYRHWLPEVAPPDWPQQVQRIAETINERDLPFALKGRSPEVIALVRYVKEQGFYDAVADGLRSAFEYDKTYFDKIVASLLPLMEKLITGKTAALISPDYTDLTDTRPIIDWRQIIRRQGIVYVGLDALSDMAVAAAVGNSMFADLVSVSGEIYKHGTDRGLPDAEKTQTLPTISLHADEFNELIGDEFIPLLNKAGGSGFQVTAYTQTWSDVEARIGNKAKAGQVAGNFNTLIMLRVKELATAEMLTNQLDTCNISTLMEVSGVNDSADPDSPIDFTSQNQDRISVTDMPMLAPATVMALPKGQAFALLEGGHLWKIRIPLPTQANDALLPKNLQEVANEMNRRYLSNDHWWAS